MSRMENKEDKVECRRFSTMVRRGSPRLAFRKPLTIAGSDHASGQAIFRHQYRSLRTVGNVPLIGALHTSLEICRCRPTQSAQTTNIQKLARHAVWFRPVECEYPLPTNNLGYALRQFQNRDVVPRADIQKHLVGIILHYEDAGVGQIFRKQEFAFRHPTAPQFNCLAVRNFGSVDFHDERGNYMTTLHIVTISRAV